MFKQPDIGQRVQLIRNYWYDQMGIIPVGTRGTVTTNGDRIFVQLDYPQMTLDHFQENKLPENKIISFYPECGPQLFNDMDISDVLAQFHLSCEYLT